MPELGSFQDFLTLWPVWLLIGFLFLVLYLTRERAVSKHTKTAHQTQDVLTQQMQDQQRVNAIANSAISFHNRT